jgi:predicted Zn finger-like uncharacterized protein
MYTRCPQCRTVYAITARQLRAGLGEALCERCQTAFNALCALGATEAEAVTNPQRPAKIPALGPNDSVNATKSRPSPANPAQHPLPLQYESYNPSADFVLWRESQQASNSKRLFWLLGSLGLLSLLVWQVSYYEGANAAQDLRIRPALEQACEIFGCALPAYRDLSRIQIIERDLYPAPDNIDGLEFRLIIANRSNVAQSFPAVKLSLMDVNGAIFAERVFQPDEYLPDNVRTSLPSAGEPVEIKLRLAAPAKEVGGFTFELR